MKLLANKKFDYPSDKSKTIYYGPHFFKSDEHGKNSMLGTILHEHLHFHHPNENVRGTDDVCLKTPAGIIVRDPDSLINECIRAYGESNAASLATYNPKDAQDNSDNFQFMIEEYVEILLTNAPQPPAPFLLIRPH